MPDTEIPCQSWTPQVQEPVSEAQILIGQFLLQLKREDLGLIDDDQVGRSHFNLPGRQVWVDGAPAINFGAGFNPAGHLHDILRPQGMRKLCGCGGLVRAEDALREAFTVP